MQRKFVTALVAVLALVTVAVCVDAQAAQFVGSWLTAHPDIATAGMALGVIAEVDAASIKSELERINGQVKEWGEKALAENTRYTAISAKTAERVDELLVKQGELQARLQEAEQKLDRRGSAPGAETPRSVGAQFVESEAFKGFQNHGGRINISAAVTSDTASGGDLVTPDRQAGIIIAPNRRLTVRDLVSPGTTSSNSVEYVKETAFTNNARPVTETTKKPESDMTYDAVSAPVRTIAHFIKAAKQILADAPGLQSQIDARLMYGLKYVEETQLLKGAGTGQNLNGIYTQATAYSAPITIASPTDIDVLRLALLQADLAEYPSDGIVLHPSSWAKIELQKDTNGSYIFSNPQSLVGPVMWGRPVVATQAMTIKTYLVGAFKLGAQIFDREGANTVVATQNEDDFVKNLVTILTEERLALAVYRPAAFIKGTFA